MSRGRQAIARARSRLDATFQRISAIDEDQLEARADFARYLCVLLSGFLEEAIAELLMEHTQRHSNETVQRYVRASLDRFQNPKIGRILQLVEKFSEEWRDDLKEFLVDERAAAIGSVVSERNRIAHGGNSDISFARVSDYRKEIDRVIDHIADLVGPLA